ncbi:site-specific integrase [Aliarcobacter skirrowii]|uniref:hypothetical protein n=1 Tax=Aliarcobacter skirrowii TaxID=28200 RepID=UPI000826AFB5|nr:hypothetical protein [Aliarcobacter skirrowii]
MYIIEISRDYCEINHLKNIDKKYILKEKRTVTNYYKITDIPTFKELVNEIYKANNLCNLKWDYINFENKILTIPRKEMKVKNPNLNDFSLPLSDEVLKILIFKNYILFFYGIYYGIAFKTENISPKISDLEEL